MKGTKLPRNSPTIINRAFSRLQFADGRAASLEDQVIVPLTNPNEMGSSVAAILKIVHAIPGYVAAFEAAYPGADGVTIAMVTDAISSYERTLGAMWIKA